MKETFLSLLIFSLFTFSKCHKYECQKDYMFDIPFSHSIFTDTINIGDTIWISTEFGPQLKDLSSGEICKFNNVNFQSTLYFLEISGNKSKYMNEKFKLINQIGDASLVFFNTDTMNSYGNGSCYLINYTFTNNYKLKLGFVPLQKGFYAANIASPFLDPKTENIEKNCNGRMGFLYAMNNKDTSINNFHLLSYSQVPFYKSISISQFNKEGLFGFIVK